MGAELELPANAPLWLALAALPLLLTACTAFTKISIVLAALRTGLGADRLLPLAAVLGLALVLTALVMAPTAEACASALELAGGLEALTAAPWTTGATLLEPLWGFLADHAATREVELFAELGGFDPSSPLTLVPAFLISELGRGLELGVMILLPFVAVDLICAQSLVLLGLANTPPQVVALPAKILLFLAADGWATIAVALVEGYR